MYCLKLQECYKIISASYVESRAIIDKYLMIIINYSITGRAV